MAVSLPRSMLVSASAVALSSVSGSGAWAQDSFVLTLPEIRIEASAAQSLLGNVQITEDEIEERNPSSIRDVFDGEASVTASGGASIAQKVYVNGIEESLLSVTIDGARQNKSAFHHTGNVLIDPALLKSVDVSEGLAPADAGPGALGGALAYTTKDARDFLAPGDSFGGMSALALGSNGQDFRGTLALAGQRDGFEGLLSVTRQTGDEYEDGDGVTMPGTEADISDYVGKLGYTTDTGHRFELSASRTEDTGDRVGQEGPGGLIFIRPDFASVVGRDSVVVEGLSRRTSYTFDYVDEQPEGWLAPKVQLTYNEQEIDAGGVYGINKSLSGTFANEFALSNGSVNAGLDFFNEKAKGEQQGEPPFDVTGEEKMWNVGLFAQARQDVTDRVSVSYGGRWDVQEFTGSDGSDFDGNGVSANGSVDVILNSWLTLNAGYATTWGGYELGEAAVIDLGTPWNYDGFTTSRSRAARVGLRYENGPFAASGALFRTDVDDITAILPTDGLRGASTDLRSQGFDGSASLTGEQAFVRLNYTYADVELDGTTIPSTSYYLGRPVGHIFGLEGAYAFNDQWRAGGTAEIALDNDDTEVDLDGYQVLNLYGAYTPRAYESVELRLDVRNVLDETYASRSADGIDFPGVVPLNEPGRTFLVTARVLF